MFLKFDKKIIYNVTLLHIYRKCKQLCIIYDKLRLCFDVQLLANSTLHRMVSVDEFQKLVTYNLANLKGAQWQAHDDPLSIIVSIQISWHNSFSLYHFAFDTFHNTLTI